MNTNPTTIGIISDIHGNYPALKTVLEDLPDVDLLISLGDVIGYNGYPQQCVQTVRDVCDIHLQGNHDRLVRYPEDYRFNKMVYEGLIHAQDQLTDDQMDWLTGLPPTKTLLDGELLIAHSHPTNVDTYVYPDQFPRVLKTIDSTPTFICLGHTHVQGKFHGEGCTDQFDSWDDPATVLNPGSVGQPRDGDNRAAYAVINRDTEEITLHRTSYPILEIQEANRQAGLPPETSSRLEQAE